MCNNCNQNNCTDCTQEVHICNQCPPTEPCDCAVKDLSTDCSVFTGDSIECDSVVVVAKNTILSDALANIVSWSCTKFSAVENFFRIINTGNGVNIFSGVSLLGEKKLRRLKSTNGSVIITQGTDDIDFSVPAGVIPDGTETKIVNGTNTTVVGTGTTPTPYQINALNSTYSNSNLGTGAQIYKDSIIVGSNTQFNLRKIKSSNSSVNIVEGADEIDITVVAGIVPDGSETKVTAGTNVTVTGTGTIASPYIINASGGGGTADGSETIINAGINISITGIGTTGNPYIINGLSSPFERADEGSGIGVYLRYRDPLNYGAIGEGAFDISWSGATSSTAGATGTNAFAAGYDVIASGGAASAFGDLTVAAGELGFVTGRGGTESGYANFLAGGYNIITDGAYATIVGQFATSVTNNISNVNDGGNTMFAVGNGTATGEGLPSSRSTAFQVYQSGLLIAPSLSVEEISAESTGKVLITKEYLNLQKVITYPGDFIGTNYTLTNADNNYEIIVANGATPVSITVPSGLTPKIGVGFTQKGTGDVAYIASGTTINNPIGLKIKGQYYQTFLSQELATNNFFLGGNTKI